MTHEPQSTDFKWTLTLEEPPRSYEARRIPCSCGWVGEWQKDAYFACASFERHVAQRAAKAEAVSA